MEVNINKKTHYGRFKLYVVMLLLAIQYLKCIITNNGSIFNCSNFHHRFIHFKNCVRTHDRLNYYKSDTSSWVSQSLM